MTKGEGERKKETVVGSVDHTPINIIIIVAILLFFALILIIKFIPIVYTSTNFWPSVLAILLIVVSFLASTFTILGILRRYFKESQDRSSKELLIRQQVDHRLDNIERRLHWTDIGFEVCIESFKALMDASSMTNDQKLKYDDKITKLLMSRIPTDNPQYLKGSELKRYFEQWLTERSCGECDGTNTR